MNPKDLVGAKKAPLRLVPPAAVIGMADGLSVGAVKYGPFNWRLQPIENVTYVEAAIRHLLAYLDGQEYSEDTEAVVGHPVHHIDHALAGLGILRDAIASGQVVEARGPSGPAADLLRAMDRSVSPAASPAPEGTVDGVTVSSTSCGGDGFCDGSCRVTTVTSETWGDGDGDIFFEGTVFRVTGVVENRGDWPPDTRVAGLLTCCGQSEHPVDCPQWR